jgi:hypothetical protein
MVPDGYWIANNLLYQQQSPIAKQGAPAQVNQTLPQPIEKERLKKTNAEKEAAAANKENQLAQANINKEQKNKQPVIARTRKPEQENSLMPPKISFPSFILATLIRGGSQIPNLSIPEETSGDVAMQLQLESDD